MTPLGLALGTFTAAAGVAIAYVLLSGLIWGSGFEPVPRRQLQYMLEVSGVGRGTRLYDLGSGFGRVVLEAAGSYGAVCVGVEIDPLKSWWSRRQAQKRSLDGRVEIRRKNLFDVDLSQADVAFVFLFPPMLGKLRDKMLREMPRGSVVVSYSHRFPEWEPELSNRKRGVYLYRIPARAEAQPGGATAPATEGT